VKRPSFLHASKTSLIGVQSGIDSPKISLKQLISKSEKIGSTAKLHSPQQLLKNCLSARAARFFLMQCTKAGRDAEKIIKRP
jgi:hypothetical protein